MPPCFKSALPAPPRTQTSPTRRGAEAEELQAAFSQDVEHVVHLLVRPSRNLPRQELHGVRRPLRVHPSPAHVVPELELDPR